MSPPFHIPARPCYHEVIADGRQLTVKTKTESHTVDLFQLQHCIVSEDTWYYFFLTTKNGRTIEFRLREAMEAKLVFDYLQPFCPGFRDTPATYPVLTWPGSPCWRIDRDSVTKDRYLLFRKQRKLLYIIPTRNLAWVTQRHLVDDSEGGDLFFLRIYTADGKYDDLPGKSVEDCYRLARMIKATAPQLRYTVEGFTGFPKPTKL